MTTKIALITGANSGIGYATAQVLLAEATSPTFHVIIAARSLEKAEGAKSSLEASGNLKGQLSTVVIDVTDPNSITKAAAQIKEQFGHLDVLINNAGIAKNNSNIQERYQACLETNVIGPALVAEAFRPLVLKSETRLSIYVSSGLGSVSATISPDSPLWPGTMAKSFPNIDAYCVSKAALNMVAMQERGLFADQNLKVYTMCPGLVRSNLRGTKEEEIAAGGNAGDPLESGRTILGIIKGDRDADDGKFVHKDGVYSW